MKFKLWIHKHDFSEEELVINPRDYNGLQIGDVVEIYHPEDTFSRLLLQVKKLSNDFQQKETVSIETTVASTFQLRAYLSVIVNRVEPRDVTLDTLELVFKDQYMSRSDLWRLQRSLIGACVYMGKKIEFAGLRFQVHEMWVSGEKVACGVIGKDTKIVNRSQSAQINIFIQMSAEMWEFDFCGELYFEKTVNGFLNELFGKWKEYGCSHDVNIVMFSRTYYSAKTFDAFPKEMQCSIIKGYDGRFYQDFFKMIINSANIDNWKEIAITLKTSFSNYLNWIGCEDEISDDLVEGRNSRASDGNMLEALNLSLNVFETFFIDVNLERTNSTVMIITPGSGVFDVDRELTNMTKLRLMDGGYAVDLVCLAEQPLHAVPLLKFHSKKIPKGKDQFITVDYNIPQWVNHSYYRSPDQRNASTRFVPRMKVPERPTILEDPDLENQDVSDREDQLYIPSGIDYDEYDAQVFTYATPRTTMRNRLARSLQKRRKADLGVLRKSSPDMISGHGRHVVDGEPQSSWNEGSLQQESFLVQRPVRAISECEDIRLGTSHGENMVFIDDDTIGESDSSPDFDTVFKRANSVNPESIFGCTLFPPIQATRDHDGMSLMGTSYDGEETIMAIIDGHKSIENIDLQDGVQMDSGKKLSNPLSCGDLQRRRSFKKVGSDKSLRPQEQDWTATILTGVDWKSLSIPACLPLTTDYFPDQKIFENDYCWYNYTIIMDDNSARLSSDEKCPKRCKMTARDKFLEAISQRVGQGYQFVTNKEKLKFLLSPSKRNRPLTFMPLYESTKEEHVLSHVQQIHHVQFDGQELLVHKYAKQNVPFLRPHQYKYKLWSVDGDDFQGACAEFSHEDNANYNWNHLDHYVTGEGEDYDMLLEDMKYWRVRFLLLPVRDKSHADANYSGDTKMIEIEGFLRFIEGLNCIKRPENRRLLFICRKHTAEDKKTYLERREGSSDNTRKRSEIERNKAPLTPNGSQKKTPSIKDSPVDTRDKKAKKISVNGGSEEPTEDHKSCLGGSVSEETADEQLIAIPSKLPPEHALHSNCPLEDVVKAMQNEEYGLSFLPEQEGLRNGTFISAEAVAWMIKSIDGINTKVNAVQLGQRMLDAKLIIHASQSAAQCFVDGMYLYFINSTEKTEEKVEKTRKISLFTAFGTKKSEEELLMNYNIKWFEVEVWRGKAHDEYPDYLQHNLLPEVNSKRDLRSPSFEEKKTKAVGETPGKPTFKSMEYDVDCNHRSDRAEWCNIYYHSNYCPDQSFSLELHWMVSTASIISERVQHWARRAISSGFHLVPAPVHPLLIYCSTNSVAAKKHPLSKPRFIPLNVECLLVEGQDNLFAEFEKSTWNRRMILFQEAILFRFGFLRDYPRTTNTYGWGLNKRKEANSNQFVHWTGSVFIRIMNQPSDASAHTSTSSARKLNFDDDNEEELSSYDSSSRRVHMNLDNLLNDLSMDYDNEKYPTGFFCTFNDTLTKKWRSTYTGDENNAKKLITSFSNFCANTEGALKEFWDLNLKESEKEFYPDEDRISVDN
eukprot:gene14226-15709_t